MKEPDSESDKLEQELEEFFKDRAFVRAAGVADGSQKLSSSERDEELKTTSSRDDGVVMMSGCCMTGCFDCPWDYKVPG